MTDPIKKLCSAFIAQREGLRLKAYPDGGGVWTIGFGHIKNVKPGDTATYAQAVDWLAEDLAPLFARLDATNREQPFSATQAMAYVSFGFNVGLGALGRVLAGQDSIDNPIHTHDAHGVVELGLVTDRALEIALLAV